jgi:hypothetical protein
MGTKFTLVWAAIICFIFFGSCSKSSQEHTVLTSVATDELLQVTVASGDAFELPLAKYGNVAIQRQAKNYVESFAGIDSKTGLYIYKYVPKADFRGVDEVVLKSSKTVQVYSAEGCNRNGSSAYTSDRVATTLVTIRLKVVD